jgi:hypothetical protein
MLNTAVSYVLAQGAGDFDPMDGVSPTLGDFGGKWLVIGGLIWGLCIVGATVYLAKGFLQYATARHQGMVERVAESAKEIKHALVGLAGLAGLPVIVLGVLKLIG